MDVTRRLPGQIERNLEAVIDPIERAGELAALDASLQAAREGRGAVPAGRGPPGIGKDPSS